MFFHTFSHSIYDMKKAHIECVFFYFLHFNKFLFISVLAGISAVDLGTKIPAFLINKFQEYPRQPQKIYKYNEVHFSILILVTF